MATDRRRIGMVSVSIREDRIRPRVHHVIIRSGGYRFLPCLTFTENAGASQKSFRTWFRSCIRDPSGPDGLAGDGPSPRPRSWSGAALRCDARVRGVRPRSRFDFRRTAARSRHLIQNQNRSSKGGRSLKLPRPVIHGDAAGRSASCFCRSRERGSSDASGG